MDFRMKNQEKNTAKIIFFERSLSPSIHNSDNHASGWIGRQVRQSPSAISFSGGWFSSIVPAVKTSFSFSGLWFDNQVCRFFARRRITVFDQQHSASDQIRSIMTWSGIGKLWIFKLFEACSWKLSRGRLGGKQRLVQDSPDLLETSRLNLYQIRQPVSLPYAMRISQVLMASDSLRYVGDINRSRVIPITPIILCQSQI